MQANADHLGALLKDTVSLRITSALGTDLVMDVTGRSFISDLKATVKDGGQPALRRDLLLSGGRGGPREHW